MVIKVPFMTTLVLAVGVVNGSEAPPEAPLATLHGGRDANHSRYVTWSDTRQELQIVGVAGAELIVDEALVIVIERPAQESALTSRSPLSSRGWVIELDVKLNGRPIGQLDPGHETLPLGAVLEGDAISIGVRLRIHLAETVAPAKVQLALEAPGELPR